MPTNGDQSFRIRKMRDGVQVISRQFGDLYPLMERIGQYLVKASQIAFLNQMFDGKKWPERSVPNYMGIVQDLGQGTTIHASRFQSKPALVVTGALRRSISYEPSAKTVRIVSGVPYARLMHEGGSHTLPITQTVKQNLASFLSTRTDLRPRLGFLFRKSSITTMVQARPFLGVAESSRDKIQEIAAKYFRDQAESAQAAGGD